MVLETSDLFEQITLVATGFPDQIAPEANRSRGKLRLTQIALDSDCARLRLRPTQIAPDTTALLTAARTEMAVAGP